MQNRQAMSVVHTATPSLSTEQRRSKDQAMLDWFSSTRDSAALDIAEIERQLAKIKI
jgi:hypothetical protein